MANMSWQYLAGFLDGEGSIIFPLVKRENEGKWNSGIRIALVSTHLEVLKAIQIFLIDYGIQGIIALKPDSRGRWGDNHVRKPCWHLRVGTKLGVKTILAEVLPYLFIKREKAKTALNFIGENHSRGHPISEETKLKLSIARKKYWEGKRQNAPSRG